MSLRDFVIQDREIVVGGQSFKVKGLSLNDLQILVGTHLDSLAAVFTGNMTVASLVQDLPEFAVALVVAGVVDEEVDAELVQGLPAGVVVDAVRGILELTFPNGQALIEAVKHLAGETTQQMDLQKQGKAS